LGLFGVASIPARLSHPSDEEHTLMETVKKVRALLVATVIIWLSVVVVGQIDGTQFVQGAAAIW
jgi:hypothetical protein